MLLLLRLSPMRPPPSVSLRKGGYCRSRRRSTRRCRRLQKAAALVLLRLTPEPPIRLRLLFIRF